MFVGSQLNEKYAICSYLANLLLTLYRFVVVVIFCFWFFFFFVILNGINQTRTVYWIAVVDWWEFFKYRWSNRWLSIALFLSHRAQNRIDGAKTVCAMGSYNGLPPGWFSCFVYLLPLLAITFILFVSVGLCILAPSFFVFFFFWVWTFNSFGLTFYIRKECGQNSIIKLVCFGLVPFGWKMQQIYKISELSYVPLPL